MRENDLVGEPSEHSQQTCMVLTPDPWPQLAVYIRHSRVVQGVQNTAHDIL